MCDATDSTRVRLVGGPSEREGRVLVYYNNTWGSVCSYYFSVASARVVCASLGFGFVGYTGLYVLVVSLESFLPMAVSLNNKSLRYH